MRHLTKLRKETVFYQIFNENKKYNKRNVLDTIEKYKLFFIKKILIK